MSKSKSIGLSLILIFLLALAVNHSAHPGDSGKPVITVTPRPTGLDGGWTLVPLSPKKDNRLKGK